MDMGTVCRPIGISVRQLSSQCAQRCIQYAPGLRSRNEKSDIVHVLLLISNVRGSWSWCT